MVTGEGVTVLFFGVTPVDEFVVVPFVVLFFEVLKVLLVVLVFVLFVVMLVVLFLVVF